MNKKSKLLIIGDGSNLPSYFSKLESLFSEQISELKIISGVDVIKFQNELMVEDLIIFIEFTNSKDNNKLIQDITSVTKKDIYLAVDFSKVLPENHDELKSIIKKNKFVDGWIDYSMDILFYYAFFKNILISNKDPIEREEIKELSVRLDELIQRSKEELAKVKKIHHKIVPLRHIEIKGLKLITKFLAGESPGGEFFDVIKRSNQLLFILTSSSSYLITSLVLSHFSKLKMKNKFDRSAYENFILDLNKDIDHLNIKNENNDSGLEAILFNIDLNKMIIEGFSFGKAEMISSKKAFMAGNDYPLDKCFFDSSYFNFPLERSEKLVIVSPGVKRNCGEILAGQKIVDFVRNQMNNPPEDLINEIFYQLKKDRRNEFLMHDASVVYIEVGKNVIVQV